MNTKNIKEFLIDTEILSNKQINEIQDKIFVEGGDENENFLETAIDLNFITPEIAKEILSLLLSIPRIDLNKKPVDLETLSILPEPISRNKKAVVFEKKGDTLSLAISNFEDLEEINEILKGFNINYYLSDISDINRKIIQYQNLLRENWGASLFSTLNSIPKIKDFAFRKYDELQPEYLKEITDSYHIEKFLQAFFEYALKSQAEFVYLDCEGETYGIYFRIFSERYKIMEISPETAVSVILKLKRYADLPTAPSGKTNKTIQEGKFKVEINDEIHDIYLSFIQTNVGVSVNIQLDKKILFPLPFPEIIPEQQEIYFRAVKNSAGLVLLLSNKDNKSDYGSMYSFVSLAEMEAKKNKEIYSLTEKPVEYKIPEVNHLSLQKGEKKTLIVSQILKNRPDVLFIDSITKPLIPILMNFVTSGKKIYLGLEQDISVFIDKLFELKFSKSKIVKNLSYSLIHQTFKILPSDNKKKYKLNSNEKKLMKKYLPNLEFKKYSFYTKNKNKFLDKNSKNITIRGIFDNSEILEELFAEKTKKNELKKSFEFVGKKSILENTLIKYNLDQIDVKEIFRYLK